MQLTDHLKRQSPLAVEQFGDPRFASAEDLHKIFLLQSLLLYSELDRIDGIGEIDGVVKLQYPRPF